MAVRSCIGAIILAVVIAARFPCLADPASDPARGDEGVPVPAYSVSKYDPTRNPGEDLKTTVRLAEKAGKHVLLQVGGDWCGWCGTMTRYFHENRAVASALARGYIIMKVNRSDENRNEAFLKRYPRISAYPHLYVLDGSGRLLHSQDTNVLEQGSSYNEKALLDFLNRWAPKQ